MTGWAEVERPDGRVVARELAELVGRGISPPAALIRQFWAAVYDEQAETYDTWTAPLAEDLVAFAGVGYGSVVLDVGTGTGRAALSAAERAGPDGHVVGVDISDAMLAVATARRSHPRITYRLMDASQLDLPDESFDVVVSSMALFFVPDPARTLREIRRVLTVGGVLAFSCFDRPAGRVSLVDYFVDRAPGGTADGMRLFRDEVRDQLMRQAGFTDIVDSVRSYPRHPASGPDRPVELTESVVTLFASLPKEWGPLPAGAATPVDTPTTSVAFTRGARPG